MTSRSPHRLDAVIVGAGPNGLTAAARLAQAGLAIHVIEANASAGGGCRSASLTLPGFVHDLGAAVHPLGLISPAFHALGLARHGLEWVPSHIALAHPLPDGTVATLNRSLEITARQLGADGDRWRSLLRPWTDASFLGSLLQPLWHLEGRPLLSTARFGLTGLQSALRLVERTFRHEPARALLGGCAAHSGIALDRAGTAAFGLLLAAAAHAADWPCARGGSQAITHALVRCLQAHGGTLETGRRVTQLRELPDARVVLFDLSPRQVAQIAGDALPAAFRHRYERYPHGPGVFKIDWALRHPIPWRNPECATATTLHVGGSLEEIARSEAAVTTGLTPERPLVLLSQPTATDPSRAPPGCHVGWAYCHVPAGCGEDMTERIEAQVERFAPGFRDCILARHTMGPAAIERANAAMIGGDIAGGRNDLAHVLFRPLPRWNPYTTPNPRLFLCSSATPPGAGVHGMCGWHAAGAVLRHCGMR